MCGIAGILDPTCALGPEALAEAAGRMADALSHRGPDGRGVWTDAAAGVALGHRRLAIVDLSPEGAQPMVSASGRWVVVFNGEIYNFEELRAELETLGRAFRGRSDTEVMLAAFDAWGPEAAISRFNGMFAFALWDRERRALLLARDRVGKKPLYYGRAGAALLFGSELKALRAHPDFRPETDRAALAAFLRRGCVPAPLSIYAGVRKLPPGCLAAFGADERGLPEPRAYWSARDAVRRALADPFRGSEEEAEAELEALLGDAVGLRMVADVPLGAFLSGGIDSSTVVALMQARSTRPAMTFTIGFAEPGYDEAAQARAAAAHLGTDHTELVLAPKEALAVVPRLPTLYDEPFADASQIPTFLVAELARRRVTVALSGDGGDELFGGYNRHLWGPRVLERAGRLPPPARRAAAVALGLLAPESWEAAYGAVLPLLPARLRARNLGAKVGKLAAALGAESAEALYETLVSQWRGPVALGADADAGDRTDASPLPEGLGPAERLMFLDLVSYLPDDVLAKVDRATMGVSLEARAPLLDYRLVEFAWRLPLSMKIRDGVGKRILRRILGRRVPPALFERPKMGFEVPISAWLRGPLREWAEGLLAEDRLRREGFLDPAPVRAAWRAHLAGKADRGQALWHVLMFQAWLEAA